MGNLDPNPRVSSPEPNPTSCQNGPGWDHGPGRDEPLARFTFRIKCEPVLSACDVSRWKQKWKLKPKLRDPRYGTAWEGSPPIIHHGRVPHACKQKWVPLTFSFFYNICYVALQKIRFIRKQIHDVFAKMENIKTMVGSQIKYSNWTLNKTQKKRILYFICEWNTNYELYAKKCKKSDFFFCLLSYVTE